jgi:hypothetical protein
VTLLSLTESTELPITAESWELANAIQMTVFRLLNTTDPATAHLVVYDTQRPGVDPYEVEVCDPYDFDLTSFEISVNPVELDQTLNVVVSCDTK